MSWLARESGQCGILPNLVCVLFSFRIYNTWNDRFAVIGGRMSETSTNVHRYHWIYFLTDHQIWLPSRATKCRLVILTWNDFFDFVITSGAYNWYFYLFYNNVFFLPLLLLVLDMIYKHNDHLLMTIAQCAFCQVCLPSNRTSWDIS